MITAITAGVIALIALAVEMKILSNFSFEFGLRSLAAIAVIVAGFAMSVTKGGANINWGWACAQLISIFLYCIICASCIAFDKEDYIA